MPLRHSLSQVILNPRMFINAEVARKIHSRRICIFQPALWDKVFGTFLLDHLEKTALRFV